MGERHLPLTTDSVYKRFAPRGDRADYPSTFGLELQDFGEHDGSADWAPDVESLVTGVTHLFKRPAYLQKIRNYPETHAPDVLSNDGDIV